MLVTGCEEREREREPVSWGREEREGHTVWVRVWEREEGLQ